MGDSLDEALFEIQKAIIEDARKIYSQKVIELFLNPKNVGVIENPDGFGTYTGPCGDTIDIYLKVKDGIIVECKFMTDGCGTTIAAGSMATILASEKEVREALAISENDIERELGGLPDESKHCALLAATALKNALLNYIDYERNPWKKAYRRDERGVKL